MDMILQYLTPKLEFERNLCLDVIFALSFLAFFLLPLTFILFLFAICITSLPTIW